MHHLLQAVRCAKDRPLASRLIALCIKAAQNMQFTACNLECIRAMRLVLPTPVAYGMCMRWPSCI